MFVIVIFHSIAFARDNYYNAGVVFYAQGHYDQALKYLYESVKTNPEKAEAVYYFANTLVKLRKFDKAKKYYLKVLEMAPYSQEALYSRQAITDIEAYNADLNFPFDTSFKLNADLYTSNNSYINNLQKSNIIIHWQKEIMPLYVYIEPSNYKEYERVSWNAFIQWQASSNDFITFERASNEDKANIVLKWLKNPTKNKFKDLFGYTLPIYKENELKRYTIYLDEKDNNGAIFLASDMFMHALHQIGHALGINAHSDNEKDVMYKLGNDGQLTRADIATLHLLYNLDADISNFTEIRNTEESPLNSLEEDTEKK